MKINSTKIILASTLICLNLSNLNANQNETITVKVPEVPKVLAKVPSVNVVTVGGTAYSNNPELEERPKKRSAIGSSHRIPPNYNKQESSQVFKDVKVGEVNNSRVSAYLQSTLIPKDELIKKLQDAGFKVLSEYKIDKKGELTSIVFTNEEITKIASKDMRGFAGSLRVLIDKSNSQISISNPLYVMKAFMQDEYNEKVAKETLDNIHSVFKDLKNSKDIVKFSRLERYQFMKNMPYYQDMTKIAVGENKLLLEKAKKSKKIVYEHHLDNGSVIIGVELSSRTSKFVKKTGYQNSGLLPYPVLIENNTAKILAPKYYIAVMYPMLSMSEFMTIATIPGAIEKDCDRVFR
ncbi:hypothetical protein SMGD1_2799 [Sulfurimonas gotlandica GD1]|uniref:Uncharacterized protein n=1 Tax=Sulfurimonas gotlandica (strain DSM 19862 / JCM 16533 / GD1) TaxID=929558 RepID=B6BJS2_SULGG|nr:hypothetical protein [Sulfurimonas gotlandica]EDZ62565.1 conserved hypothetical protein [Sulfurimonas gotlandica GD1]EHP31321.1 hypothetical protein SMGD1_2799 [Sulfurimonas gotlandica GD1]